ncbi:MAG: response regulator [Planctomycetota bacterium]
MNDSIQKRLMVVIAEPLLSQLVSFRLELLGYSVTHCETTSHAMDQLKVVPHDVILVDTQLPDADGLEHLRKLTKAVEQNPISLIVISLDPSLETVERAYHRGATDYLITPFDPTVLEQKIQYALIHPGTIRTDETPVEAVIV